LALQYLRRLVSDFPPQLPGFDLRSGHVGFVIDKVALGQVFFEYLGFSCRLIPPTVPLIVMPSGVGTVGQTVADIRSGPSPTSSPNKKVKVKFFLDLINEAPRHENAWGSRGIAPSFFTSVLAVGIWSASRPCRFTLWERSPGIHWICGWLGPRTLWRGEKT
jgi:hypothetical protein